MTLSVSKRSASIEQAEIRAMSIECEKAGGINLAQGVRDTQVPLLIRENAHSGIENGFNSYIRFDGLAELREAIAQKMRQYNGITADPETEIVVSAGSTGAFYCACLALLDPGDEVILFEPYYGYHVNTLLAVEAVPAYVTLRPPDWSFATADLERATTTRTKALSTLRAIPRERYFPGRNSRRSPNLPPATTCSFSRTQWGRRGSRALLLCKDRARIAGSLQPAGATFFDTPV